MQKYSSMADLKREGGLKLTSSKALPRGSRLDVVDGSNNIVAALPQTNYKYRLNELS
jgi:hypothetical protein